jgi:hypothetical protein
MNRFILKNIFIKLYIYYFFSKYFYKNKRFKLCFEGHCIKRVLLNLCPPPLCEHFKRKNCAVAV